MKFESMTGTAAVTFRLAGVHFQIWARSVNHRFFELQLRCPRVIENASADPDHYQGVDERLSFHTRNLLGVPMKTPTRVLGVVQALNKIDNQRFSDDDIAMLRTLASQAAVAIENARMFQQSDFIAELVHELRNPLVALKASTTLLKLAIFSCV